MVNDATWMDSVRGMDRIEDLVGPGAVYGVALGLRWAGTVGHGRLSVVCYEPGLEIHREPYP